MKTVDVIVVGASFSGISCAKKLALEGFSVAVLEKKRSVRDNIHTTGILVNEAADLLSLPAHLYKEISEVRLYSSSLKYLEIKSDKYIFLATDTPALMEYMVEDAAALGVQFFMNTPFKDGAEYQQHILVNDGAFQCKFLVGADGAKSNVADAFGLGKNQKFLIGAEFEYKNAEIENPRAFYCFLSHRYAPGYIGWVIPGPNVTQVGIAQLYQHKKQSRPDMEGFISFIQNQVKLRSTNIVEKRGGLIPIGGVVKPFYQGNVILVGDAAGIVSPLTAGGIHTAIFYGTRLGELISEYLKNGGLHPGVILAKEYPKFLRKHFYRWIFNYIPDGLFNIFFKFPGFHYIAHGLFFLKKRLPRKRS